MEAVPVTVVAGVDIGNATTEVVMLDGRQLLGADRLPTRGRKGSADSLRGAAALVRRMERRLAVTVGEARIAPLRAAATATLTIPPAVPDTGRLRVLAAGVPTPGGAGTCVGRPFWLDGESPGREPPGRERPGGERPGGDRPGGDRPGGASDRPGGQGPDIPRVALVPAQVGYVAAARRLRRLLAAGIPVGAVLAGSDEGVLIANRLGVPVPVLDQVDVAAAAACTVLAVEVRRPGQPLTLLTDPVALSAALRLGSGEARDAAIVSRALLDYGNGVIGLAPAAAGGPGRVRPSALGPAAPGLAAGSPAEPWVVAHGRTIGLRAACRELAGWPVGTVTALGTPDGETSLDDLFAVDLAAAADTATARRGSVGQAALVSSLHRLTPGSGHAAVLADLLGCPVHRVLSEPAAARLGASTTPGARPDAVVVDVGAGTIDVIAPDREVVAAGAGDLLTVAVAETLGVPRAAADWVKRGPCVRLDGSHRFEAEDGSRGFLDGPADPAAAGMLAAAGPAGWLPFDRRHSPAEWRAIRLRLKEAVFAANLARVLRTLGRELGQVLIVGGPAGDDELLGVLLRTLPEGVTAGRGNVGGTLAGIAAGHRHAAALGLALAPPEPAVP
jgi:Diol dehydratase reactivase ATPase-like domain/DD-reactivating factor swiveling domain